MKSKIGVLVTAVGAPPGYNAVAALNKIPGLRIVQSDNDRLASGFYAFPELRSEILPKASHGGRYIQALKRICRKHKIQVVLPCIEDEVVMLARYADDLRAAGIRTALPAIHSVNRMVDKYQLTQLARSLRIPCPKAALVTRPDQPMPALGLPMVVKPVIGHGARGFQIIRNEKGWRVAIGPLLKDHSHLLAQEFIPGSDGSMLLCGLLYDHQSRLRMSYQSRSIKTLYSFGGPATGGRPIRHPQICRWSRQLAEQAGGWKGPINFEFKIHSRTKVPYLMDANPRLWGYVSLAVAVGMNFPYAAVKAALGKPIRLQDSYSTRPMMIRIHQDIVVSAAA